MDENQLEESAKKNSNRRNNPKYTPEEDAVIRNHVQKYGACLWKNCAQLLPGRDGNNCRDRWVNYLSREDDVEFSTEQDELFLQAVEVNGTRWSYIRDTFFPEFSDIDLKNHYNKLKHKGPSQPSFIFSDDLFK